MGGGILIEGAPHGGSKVSRRDQLAGFHQTISKQLNARLEESPRFFWALVVVSTGYGYVLWNVGSAAGALQPKIHPVATFASVLSYFTVLWASWYLAALGYGFRFLQNCQHCVERALGWYEYAPEPGKLPTGTSVYWVLASIYIAHVFGLHVFLAILFVSFCWLWWGNTCVVIGGVAALVFGLIFIPGINFYYLQKFRRRRKPPEEIGPLVE
jgi:hypothetical protein